MGVNSHSTADHLLGWQKGASSLAVVCPIDREKILDFIGVDLRRFLQRGLQEVPADEVVEQESVSLHKAHKWNHWMSSIEAECSETSRKTSEKLGTDVKVSNVYADCCSSKGLKMIKINSSIERTDLSLKIINIKRKNADDYELFEGTVNITCLKQQRGLETGFYFRLSIYARKHHFSPATQEVATPPVTRGASKGTPCSPFRLLLAPNIRLIPTD
ncbi:hypothetical protein TNIN_83941 [Trichonephila inaurata madagascariensis]|uniref:Uncharacterized protein n=1 Tax=Trichonephila inaurata madagascariensis TaxID=2747483 RepID=A0A8X6KMY5_9ARAC|nr:hypothetical protein TNIN_83941 [Trichonephila inaurata madagascariensis]